MKEFFSYHWCSGRPGSWEMRRIMCFSLGVEKNPYFLSAEVILFLKTVSHDFHHRKCMVFFILASYSSGIHNS